MLEYWNSGRMGFGKMDKCIIGIITLDMEIDNVNRLESFFEINIPLFHYSMCEAKLLDLNK